MMTPAESAGIDGLIARGQRLWWLFALVAGLTASAATVLGVQVRTLPDALQELERAHAGRDSLHERDIAALASRMIRLEESLLTVEALALAQCISTRNPAIAAALACEERRQGRRRSLP